MNVFAGTTMSVPVPMMFEAVKDVQLLVPKIKELPVVVALAPAVITIELTPTDEIVAPAGIAGPITDIPVTSPVVDGIPLIVVVPMIVSPVVDKTIKSEILPK
jgi:hypothetical protein